MFPNICSADSAIVLDAASLGQKLGIIISQAILGELRLPKKGQTIKRGAKRFLEEVYWDHSV
jgi:hypothetical protein